MKILSAILVILVFSGCASRPKRPNTYPALYYPYATLADLHAGPALKYEGKDIGLDGGSHVYIFSTPKKTKLALWNLSQLVKQEYGYDVRLNAFRLQTGSENENMHLVMPGSEMEKLLISGINTASEIPAEIVAGLKDRSHAIADSTWRMIDGKIASFKAPESLQENINRHGLDTEMEFYESKNLTFTFDLGARSISADLQTKIQKLITELEKHVKEEWKKSVYVDGVGCIYCYDSPERDPERPHYLYLGFATGIPLGSFAIHVRITNTDQMDEVLRMLRSIKIKPRK